MAGFWKRASLRARPFLLENSPTLARREILAKRTRIAWGCLNSGTSADLRDKTEQTLRKTQKPVRSILGILRK
jgi:hypothetical protein